MPAKQNNPDTNYIPHEVIDCMFFVRIRQPPCGTSCSSEWTAPQMTRRFIVSNHHLRLDILVGRDHKKLNGYRGMYCCKLAPPGVWLPLRVYSSMMCCSSTRASEAATRRIDAAAASALRAVDALQVGTPIAGHPKINSLVNGTASVFLNSVLLCMFTVLS